MAEKQADPAKARTKRQKPKLKMLKPRLRELDLSIAKPLRKKKWRAGDGQDLPRIQ